MKPLRVLHIYRTYFPESRGGLEESIRQLCLATQPLGVSNTVFCLARNPHPERMQRPEGQLVRARSWAEIASCNFGGWDAVKQCRAAADKADVLQVHYPWPFADMLIPFVRSHHQPLLVTYVSDIVRQRGLGLLYAPLRKHLLGSADCIVASSPNYVRTSEILANHRDKVVEIPHCMEPLPHPDPVLVERWQAKLGKGFFLFIGVLRYYKGLHFLLEAARSVRTPVVLIGDGPEGEALRAKARNLNLDQVRFLGALPNADKLAILSLCRAVIFPSHLRSEAFGMTLLEGAQAAKPLVSCEIGTGTSWINVDGETGLVVAPENPSELARAMNTLATNDVLCKRLGEGAHLRWERLFSPAVVGRAYRALYDKLLEDRT